MKPKRRAVPGISTRRSPTVRRVKPAIRPAARPPAPGPRTSATAAPREPVGEGAPSLDALGGRPVDLEVDLGRGLVLRNPVIAAAGPFGYGAEVADLVDLERLGGIVTRGTTLKPRGGHPGPRLAEVPAGLLVGVGLQNPGIDAVLDRYATTWAKWPVPVILNLCGDTASELAEIARRLEGAPGVAGIELNLSCGGAGRGGVVFAMDADAAASAVSAVRRATDLPIIAKLSAAAADVRSVARSVEAAGADAISAINTLPGFLPSARPARRGARQRLRRDLRACVEAHRPAGGLRDRPGRGHPDHRDRRGLHPGRCAGPAGVWGVRGGRGGGGAG